MFTKRSQIDNFSDYKVGWNACIDTFHRGGVRIYQLKIISSALDYIKRYYPKCIHDYEDDEFFTTKEKALNRVHEIFDGTDLNSDEDGGNYNIIEIILK